MLPHMYLLENELDEVLGSIKLQGDELAEPTMVGLYILVSARKWSGPEQAAMLWPSR